MSDGYFLEALEWLAQWESKESSPQSRGYRIRFDRGTKAIAIYMRDSEYSMVQHVESRKIRDSYLNPILARVVVMSAELEESLLESRST